MAVRVGPRRGAARRRRIHPSTGARTDERVAAAPSSSASLVDQRARKPARCSARVGLCRGAARRWCVHPSAARTPARGLVAVPSRGELWSVARREEARMNPRVHARAPTAFCSTGIHAWPLDANGRLTFNGPSRGLGGTQLSRPRPTTSPGARSAPCASGPMGRFHFWAGFEL
jgi:hypothetical protein